MQQWEFGRFGALTAFSLSKSFGSIGLQRSFQFTKANCLINVFQFRVFVHLTRLMHSLFFCSGSMKYCAVFTQCFVLLCDSRCPFMFAMFCLCLKKLPSSFHHDEKFRAIIETTFKLFPLSVSKAEFWLLNNSLFAQRDDDERRMMRTWLNAFSVDAFVRQQLTQHFE